MDCLQKTIWYGFTKMDYRQSKMYKISGEVIKFIGNTMQNWWVELISRGKSLTEVKTLERDLPGWYTILITFYNSNDATESHTSEMHRWIHASWIAGKKKQPPHVHGTTSNIFKKWKRIETLIQTVRLYSENIGMEFGIENNKRRME